MTIKLDKYAAVISTALRARLAYRTDMLAEAPIIILRIWVMSQFYGATYASTGVTEFDGLTFVQLIWVMSIIQGFESSATEPSVPRIIEEEVKTGSLAYSLNKPYSYILYQFATFMGRSFGNMFINLLVCTICPYILVGPLHTSFFGACIGLGMMFLGYLLYFAISLVIGLLAFWIEDISSIDWLYRSTTIIFGGAILPLALFPERIKRVAELLPFGQLYYSAARLMVKFDYNFFIKFFSIQLFWLIVFCALAGYLMKKGLKRVSISGG